MRGDSRRVGQMNGVREEQRYQDGGRHQQRQHAHDAEVQCLVDFGEVAADQWPESQKDHTEQYQPGQAWNIGPAVVARLPDRPTVGGQGCCAIEVDSGRLLQAHECGGQQQYGAHHRVVRRATSIDQRASLIGQCQAKQGQQNRVHPEQKARDPRPFSQRSLFHCIPSFVIRCHSASERCAYCLLLQ